MHLPLNPPKIPIVVEQAINLQYKRWRGNIRKPFAPKESRDQKQPNNNSKTKITKHHDIV